MWLLRDQRLLSAWSSSCRGFLLCEVMCSSTETTIGRCVLSTPTIHPQPWGCLAGVVWMGTPEQPLLFVPIGLTWHYFSLWVTSCLADGGVLQAADVCESWCPIAKSRKKVFICLPKPPPQPRDKAVRLNSVMQNMKDSHKLPQTSCRGNALPPECLSFHLSG